MTPLIGRLWDISRHGACLALLGPKSMVLPAPGRLSLVDSAQAERHELEVTVRWSTPLSHTTFVGVQFSAGLLPQDSFLRQYMRLTWTDTVPRTRFEI